VVELHEWHPDLQPADERTALTQRLDHCRDTVVANVIDLSDAQTSAHLLPATEMTVGGIVKHLAWVEDHWFQARLLGRALPEPWASAPLDAAPDWPFRSSVEDSVDDLVATYRDACERSRRATAAHESLDAVAHRPSFGVGPVNLRWVLVHLSTETARHAGHLDLLRDAIDAAGVGRA